jgi:protocatechuate 3,4-dioxygenase beta subunit
MHCGLPDVSDIVPPSPARTIFGRPPHLHVRARPASGPTLATQIYIAGGGMEGDVVLSATSRGTLERLTMTLVPMSGHGPGALAGTFDIVR